MLESCVFFKNFYDSARLSGKSVQLEFFTQICEYVFYDREIPLSKKAQALWSSYKPIIDKNIQFQKSASRAGKISAQKRAQKSTPVENANQHNGNDNYNNKDNDNGNGITQEVSSAVKCYMNLIAPDPSPDVINTINDFISKGMTEDCIMEIIDYCRRNKKTAWSYIRKAIQGCYDDGIRTEEEYTSRHNNTYPTYSPPTTKKKSKFHNMIERDIDFDELEAELFEETRQMVKEMEE